MYVHLTYRETTESVQPGAILCACALITLHPEVYDVCAASQKRPFPSSYNMSHNLFMSTHSAAEECLTPVLVCNMNYSDNYY